MQPKIIYIPYLSNHSHIICAGFKHFGIQSEVMVFTTKESLNASKKYLSGKECLPCSILAGDMISTINTPNFNPETAIFYTPFHRNYCRYGQYIKLQRIILEELGLPNIPSYDINLNKDAIDILNIKNKLLLSELVWEGLVTVDCLNSWLYRNRPYNINLKDTEYAYNICLTKLCNHIEKYGSVIPILKDIIETLKLYTIKNKKQKPVIGIVGEIYTRLNYFSNSNLIVSLENLGVECQVAPLFLMDDWFKYSHLVKSKTWYQHIEAKIKDFYQERTAKKILKYFQAFIAKEPSAKELRKNTKYYFNPCIKDDEVFIIVGKAIDFIKQKNVKGIIEVMPYNCMFGNIALTLMQKIREDYNIPFLCLHFDGLKQVVLNNRLEAFVYQCKFESPI